MKRRLLTAALWLVLAAPAFGQGCAMCYTGAEASGSKSQKALDRAVLVLLAPALTMLGGFLGVAFIYRRDRGE